jgi:hypothetical protein
MRDDAITLDAPSVLHPTLRQGNSSAAVAPNITPSQTKALLTQLSFLRSPDDKSPSPVFVGYRTVTPPLPVPTGLARRPPRSGPPVFHAVFISGLPKLPCSPYPSWLSRISVPTMSIDIKHLAPQPSGSIWHLNCNRTGRCHRSRAPRVLGQATRQRRPAQRNRWLSLPFRTRLNSRTPRRAGVAQKVEPKRSAPTWRKSS